MRLLLCLALVAGWYSPAFVASAAPAAAVSAPFELREGDRVVFLGDTLMEREQYHGWMEVMLTTRFPDRNVTFRNLGWSADTPAGDSRFGLSLLQAGLEPSDEGWKQLQAQIQLTKPTVVFVGYGMASSFAGQAGLPKFKENLTRLIDTLGQLAPGVRVVLLSPIRHENDGLPLPDPTEHNRDLQSYTDAIREVAAARGTWFVSLFDTVVTPSKAPVTRPLTDNGIHLNDAGYKKVAQVLEKGLGWPSGKWQKSAQTEALRQRILRKNEWFFYRSRPQNMAYIFGFRKKEQGQNAVEIPKFDPLIETEEGYIAKLRGLKAVKVPDLESRIGASTVKFKEQPHPNFEVGEGLEVSLWAENPLLHKPIQMNFDPRGRLWVASSEVYPQIEPGQQATDKIIILEDTTGSGHADKSTVFVDGLLIPTGVEPGDGGCYVAQSTELLHFKDTNGDGKADQKRIVLSSFGTEDTHHNLHTLRWGPDGNLYMSQSIYTRSDVETPNGIVRLKSGGVFQLRPSTLQLDILFRGWINSWGHQFDQFGQSFLTDGAGSGGINYGVPGAMYVTYAKARRILGSISAGSYPKFASIEIIYSQQFPDDWQGSVVTCDFRAHRVVHFGMAEEGSGYATKELPDILRTTDDSFRPIDVKLGPDGAIYVADWSNPIIQHGEVDFRDPRRDREHGRIWRITYKGRAAAPRPQLVKASNTDLLNELTSPNSFNRAQSRRVLIERGDKVLPTLKAWTAKQTDEMAQMNALWMYEAYDRPQPELLQQVLAAKDGRVRAAATRVLSEWNGRVGDSLPVLEKLVADPHPRVRLEAVRALANIKTAKAAEVALRVLDKPMDGFLDYALWLTVNDLAEPWLAAVKSGEYPLAGHEKQLEFGLKAVEPELAGDVLANLFASKPLPKDGQGPWIELMGQAGGAPQLERMFEQLLMGGFDPAASQRVLASLADAARLRNLRPTGDLAAVAKLLKSDDEAQRTAAIRLAGAWHLPALAEPLLAICGNGEAKPAVRAAAFESLRQIGGGEVMKGLKKLTAADRPAIIRKEAVVTLAGLNIGQALPVVIESLKAVTDQNDARELWRELIGIKGLAPVLAKKLNDETLPVETARTGLRVAREGNRNQELVATLTKLSGLTVSDKELTTAELQAIAAEALAKGDPARGELIFRRPEMACTTCHAIGGAGGKVGPDMTSIGASAPADYLVESVLYPNRKIKEGYHSVLVTTKDDQEFSGILVRETDRELVLRNTSNQEVSIAKNNIATRQNGGSLMPSGLVDSLLPEERLDLYKFLSMLGKPGAYDAAKSSAARLWRIYNVDSKNQHRGSEPVVKGDFTLPDWVTVLSHVNGVVPQADIAKAAPGLRASRGLFAATQFSSNGGPAKFAVVGGPVVDAWLNGKVVKLGNEATLTLPAGVSTLVVQLNDQQLPQEFSLRSTDVSFLAN